MRLQAILFDIDGTLVDSNELHAQCWLEAFLHFDRSFPYETIHEQLGKGGDLLVPDLLDVRDMRKFGEELKRSRSRLFVDRFLPRVRPFPGIRELFEKLRSCGVRLALASSSDHDEVQYYTRLLGVEDLIDTATSKKDAELSKPSPEIFRAALERTGCDPLLTFVVGDTPYDILAAHRIALPVVAVRSGNFGRELLAKAEFLFQDATTIGGRIDEMDAWFDE